LGEARLSRDQDKTREDCRFEKRSRRTINHYSKSSFSYCGGSDCNFYKQVLSDQVFTTSFPRNQFQKDAYNDASGEGLYIIQKTPRKLRMGRFDANLTLKATPHNLEPLYPQQVSILV